MLAAACPAQNGQSVLDLGCGVGSAGLCVLTRVAGASLTGIDIQRDHIALAQRNATLNGLDTRATFLADDIRARQMPSDLGTFDHIICNPPYMEAGKHIHSPSAAKAQAMGHVDADLDLQVWATSAWNHIKGKGSFTMVHDAGRLDDIIHALYSVNGRKRYGNVEIFPLYPKEGVSAKRVIVRAWKHNKSIATMHRGMIMHDDFGDYTKEADNVLRHAASLF